MKIVVANPRGFCAGVNMAIESLDKALSLFGAPIYVYHEIVHNRIVVEHFKKKGVQFINSVDEAPAKSTLLYSAHGVSPEIRSQALAKNIQAIDATCPLVTKVHLEAIRFAKQGYQIILIGHRGHDEVLGTMGEAPNETLLVETVEDVAEISLDTEQKIAYLTQTTLSVDEAEVIVKALKKKFPNIEGPPREDICYATQNRQDAVRTFAKECDLILVLGSQNSSNSQRLREIASGMGKASYLIDTVEEIQESWLEGIESILVTAGASAPEEVVRECVDHLKKLSGAIVIEKNLRSENVTFGLPKELRQPTPSI